MTKKDIFHELAKMKILSSKRIDTNKLFDDDYHYTDFYGYTNEIETNGLSQYHVIFALLMKQQKTLNIIKNIMIFFMVLFCIGILLFIISVFKF